MSSPLLTEQFLADAAGWQAMKEARGLLAADRVLSSDWSPPVLKGVVQAGTTSYRAGLVIKSAVDLENLCTCREARDWGKICAHAVAVGLHYLRSQQAAAPGASVAKPARAPSGPTGGSAIRRAAPDSPGEPAEIFVIFPPNFAEAAARGHVTLFFEGQTRQGRWPLNALPSSRPYSFSQQDQALLDRLEALGGGHTPALLRLTAQEGAALLPLLVDHPRVTLGKSTALAVRAAPWPVPLRATLRTDGQIELALAAAVVPPRVFGQWVFHERTLRPLGLPASCLDVLQRPLRIPRDRVPQFLHHDWPQLAIAGAIAADFSPDDFVLEPLTPRFHLRLTGNLGRLEARLECRYGERVVPLHRSRLAEADSGVGFRTSDLVTALSTQPDEALCLPDPHNPTRYGLRDLAAEHAALARLLRAGFSSPDAEGHCLLSGQDNVLDFFAREYPRLQRQWEVTLDEDLARWTAQKLERLEPRFQVSASDMSWFDFSVSFTAPSGERFSPADIQRLILSGRSHTRLRNGKIALLDTGAVEELQEVLRDCAPQQHGGAYRIHQAQAGFLEATLREHAGWQVQAPAAWRERARPASGDAPLECPPLGELEGVLRPYQKAGVAWLAFLRRNGFGGILADEMGLGKTVQVLALLQACGCRGETAAFSTDAASGGTRRAQMSAAPKPPLPSLVICPASLVFNWVAEAARFTPRLRVLALHGPDRHALFDRIPQSDLVITSYALIRRDAERYRGWEFDTVVLDEAQHIKNRQTQNAQAVKAIRSRHRLVLTGTPLENSVLDLWSLFDFLMPGYLGSAQDFRERYEVPITRERSAAVQARLARRLRPFVLRRRKREVAPELPARIDQVAWCELTEAQRAVYQQVLEAGRREALQAVGAQGLARSRMVVLTALLRLRQVCCDLRLLEVGAGPRPAPEETTSGAQATGQTPAQPSGKIEVFSELLEEILDGDHRALVFSQFTSMLALLREELKTKGVEYCYLDGSTPNRGNVVARFQQGHAPVFLISLKAGGVGLNLTAADTVVHFDPWWNPAAEDQASDRAHRIGQRRVVTSYKLITRGTVEEKLLQLQERKRAVIQGTLASEEQLAEALTWEEIQELLAG